MDPIEILLIILGAIGVTYLGAWGLRILQTRAEWKSQNEGRKLDFPSPVQIVTGFITDFFDTWGIGSFATTTALFKFFKTCPDRLIPGTLNVGHTLPTIVQAYIYIQAVKVETTTLISMIVASVAGAWFGSGIVAGWSKRKVQIGMGVALAAAAALLARQQFSGDVQFSADANGLEGARFWIGVAGNFLLGALMTLGIGLYAPCMIMVSLLGMNSKAAFPIMMGSCAFLMPVASIRFVHKDAYSVRAALGLALGGIPAVFCAEYLVAKTDLNTIRWVVLGVVVYTAATMLYSATQSKTEGNN